MQHPIRMHYFSTASLRYTKNYYWQRVLHRRNVNTAIAIVVIIMLVISKLNFLKDTRKFGSRNKKRNKKIVRPVIFASRHIHIESPTHPLTYLPTHLCTYPPTYQPTYPPMYLPTYLSTYLSTYVPTHTPTRPLNPVTPPFRVKSWLVPPF